MQAIRLCCEGLGFHSQLKIAFAGVNESCSCVLIELFCPCFILNFSLYWQKCIQIFRFLMVYTISILMPVTLRVLRLLWVEHGFSEHYQSPSGAEAHWSSWLHNNASPSVNNYASSPLKDKHWRCSWCLSEGISKCTEACVHLCTVCGEEKGGSEVAKEVLFNHPDSHISCSSADEAEQPRSLTTPPCRECCIINNDLVI